MLESQDAVLLGQSLTNASGMIGKKVTGTMETKVENENGESEVKVEQVTGVVDRVSIDGGKPILHIGDKKFPLAKLLDVKA